MDKRRTIVGMSLYRVLSRQRYCWRLWLISARRHVGGSAKTLAFGGAAASRQRLAAAAIRAAATAARHGAAALSRLLAGHELATIAAGTCE